VWSGYGHMGQQSTKDRAVASQPVNVGGLSANSTIRSSRVRIQNSQIVRASKDGRHGSNIFTEHSGKFVIIKYLISHLIDKNGLRNNLIFQHWETRMGVKLIMALK